MSAPAPTYPYPIFEAAVNRSILGGMTIDQHRIRPPIHRAFRFEDAREAYQAQSAPDLFGKLVIEP